LGGTVAASCRKDEQQSGHRLYEPIPFHVADLSPHYWRQS
jgi:hypothetical protein